MQTREFNPITLNLFVEFKMILCIYAEWSCEIATLPEVTTEVGDSGQIFTVKFLYKLLSSYLKSKTYSHRKLKGSIYIWKKKILVKKTIIVKNQTKKENCPRGDKPNVFFILVPG